MKPLSPTSSSIFRPAGTKISRLAMTGDWGVQRGNQRGAGGGVQRTCKKKIVGLSSATGLWLSRGVIKAAEKGNGSFVNSTGYGPEEGTERSWTSWVGSLFWVLVFFFLFSAIQCENHGGEGELPRTF